MFRYRSAAAPIPVTCSCVEGQPGRRKVSGRSYMDAEDGIDWMRFCMPQALQAIMGKLRCPWWISIILPGGGVPVAPVAPAAQWG